MTCMHVELKSGRIPAGISHRMGYWKAEEFQKFAFPASECVLGGIIPDDEYHIWILMVRLTELFFGAGRSGWTKEMIQLAKHLVNKHNINTEELQGLKSCHVTLHNLVHLLEDIDRFSSPDNFWCYSFERAVRKYIENSTNKKNIEQTFANAEARREFLKFFRPHQQCQLQSEGLHAREIVSDEIMHACNFLSNIIYYTAWCKQH